jgi:hypothetical protein
MKYLVIGMLLSCYLLPLTSYSQDASASSITDKIANFPSGFFKKVNDQAASLDQRITAQTEKSLRQLAKKEDRLRKKLYKQDSLAAKRLFENNPLDYTALLQRLQSKSSSIPAVPFVSGSTYLPYLDSVKTSLKFLQQNKDLLANGAAGQIQINASLAQVSQLQNKVQTTEQIQQLIQQRKAQIRESLSQYSHMPAGLQSAYQGYSQKAYYYGAQLKAYRDEANDPDKLTKRALTILNQTPGFQSFMKTHSDLSSLFGPLGGESTGSAKALAGLQTRAGVQQQLQGQVSSGGPDAGQAIQQQLQSAKAKLKALQDKVTQAGGGNSAMDIPDFRPNSQKTKSLLGRLEGGINIQSLPSTYAFPATTDFGASLGYKLDDKNTVGIQISYKMGWGKDIQHIAISNQGLGLRSFLQKKIKGSFFAYAGFEYNYQQIIYSVSQINNLNYWTKSGLIGISKQYKINSRLKGNLQLLWDFLGSQQVPRTQAILFRTGYNF